MRFSPEWWAFWAGVWAVGLTVGAAIAGLVAWWYATIAAGESEKRTESLERNISELNLKAQEQRATAASLETKSAEQQQRAAEAETKLIAAQLELRKYIDAVDSKRQPRHLTKVQAESVVGLLRPFSGTQVNIICGDAEACAFSKQLSSVFRQAGLVVSGGDGDVTTVLRPFIGLEVAQRSPGNTLPVLAAICEALGAFSARPVFDTTGSTAEGAVTIFIGIKP